MASIPGNAATLLTSGPIAKLGSVPGVAAVVAQVEDVLFALDEGTLASAGGTRNPLALDAKAPPTAACRVVNDGFIGWTLDARQRSAVVSYTGFGEVTSLLPPPEGEKPAG